MARGERLNPAPLVSIVTLVEMEGGVARAEVGKMQRRLSLDALYETLDILPFGAEEARAYGRILAENGFVRGRIVDRMIAAQAIVADATLVTLNARDFRDISGLRMEDWSV